MGSRSNTVILGSAFAQQRNEWLVRRDIIKCLFLVGHYLITSHAAGNYFCASCDSSFAVVPFQPCLSHQCRMQSHYSGSSPETQSSFWPHRSTSELCLPAQGLGRFRHCTAAAEIKDLVQTNVTKMNVVWWGGEHQTTSQPPSESPYAPVLLKLFYLNTSGPYVSHYSFLDFFLDISLCITVFFLRLGKNLCMTSYIFTADKTTSQSRSYFFWELYLPSP